MNNKYRFKKPATIRNKKTNYKTLIIWKLAHSLVPEIYQIANSLPDYESKNITDQMRRSAVSITLNIAEGASSPFKKIFYSQLNYAYCSAKELEVLIMLCRNLKYIDNNTFSDLYEKLDKLKCHLYKFIIKIERELDNNSKNKNLSFK